MHIYFELMPAVSLCIQTNCWQTAMQTFKLLKWKQKVDFYELSTVWGLLSINKPKVWTCREASYCHQFADFLRCITFNIARDPFKLRAKRLNCKENRIERIHQAWWIRETHTATALSDNARAHFNIIIGWIVKSSYDWLCVTSWN